MNLLRLRLPIEGLDAEIPWALYSRDGTLQRSGRAVLDALPAAQRCELLLPAEAVLLVREKLPKLSRARVQALLPVALEERTLTEPEANHVVHLGDAGIVATRAVPETLCAPWNAGTWTLVLQESGGFVRCAEHLGYALDRADARPPVGLTMAMEAAAAENAFPKEILVYAAGCAPDLAAWQKALELPLRIAGAWDWQHAALPQVNLLQGEFAPRSRRADWLPPLRPALWLAAALLALHVAGTAIDVTLKTLEQKRLTDDMRQTFLAAFPDAQAVVDPPLQMRRKLAELRRAAGEPGDTDFVPLLAALAEPLAALPPHSVRGVRYEGGKLQIDLRTGTAATASLQRPGFRIQSEAAGQDGVLLTVTRAR